jgi:hypothetical protein
MAQPGASILKPSLLLGSLFLLLPVPRLAVAQQPIVQTVEVRLAVEGAGPPATIRQRLHETVETVAQRLLAGRSVEQLRSARTALQATLSTVVGRVVAGYGIAALSIEASPQAVAQVDIRLRPERPLIEAVEVSARTPLHEAVADLVVGSGRPLLRAAADVLLVGVPVGALEWAQGLVSDEIRRAIEDGLPGFTAVARVRPGIRTAVEAELVPRDDRIIRNIGFRFRSSSIPTILWEQHTPSVASLAEPLRGLPVAFAERHRQALERLISTRLRTYPPVEQYRIVVATGLRVGETTFVTVVADSLLYRARLEAVVNVGSQAPGPELRVYLGRFFGGVEGFTEVGLVPNTLSTRIDVGVRYRLSESFDLGTNIGLNAVRATGWVVYRFNPDLDLRTAYEIHTRVLETSLRYRLNDFLAGELVGTSRGEYWARLISNL